MSAIEPDRRALGFGVSPSASDQQVCLHPNLELHAVLHTQLTWSCTAAFTTSWLWVWAQEQDVTKQAEQRFWLPLERTGGRQAGELCVSLLLAKVGCLPWDSMQACCGPSDMAWSQSTESEAFSAAGWLSAHARCRWSCRPCCPQHCCFQTFA